jgi:hypothetical protein
MRADENSLTQLLFDTCDVALREIVRIRTASWSIARVQLISCDDGNRVQAPLIGVATVETDDYAVLSGAYEGLPSIPHLGLTQAAAGAYATALLRARGISPEELEWVYLDIVEAPAAQGARGPLRAVCVPPEVAVAHQWLDQGSDAWEAIRRYDLAHVHVIGEDVSGPRKGLVEAVAWVVGEYGAESMLDLAAGTLTASVVALEHGAARAVAVDHEFCDAGRAISTRYGARLTLIEADFRAHLIPPDIDLIVADLYYHELPARAAEPWFAALLRHPAALVMPIGLSHEAGWIAQVLAALAPWSDAGHVAHFGGEAVFIRPSRSTSAGER